MMLFMLTLMLGLRFTLEAYKDRRILPNDVMLTFRIDLSHKREKDTSTNKQTKTPGSQRPLLQD